MARDERDPEELKAINEWLKTNEVTICPPGAKSEPGEVGYTWGRPDSVGGGGAARLVQG